MMDNRRIGRRSFMRLLAGLGALVVCGPLRISGWPTWRGGLDLSFSILFLMLNHRESAVAVGREYLRVEGKNADRLDLIRRIISGPVFEGIDAAGIDPRALLSMMQHQVRNDFELGRTVEVDGWILSVTEAGLCALAALLDS